MVGTLTDGRDTRTLGVSTCAITRTWATWWNFYYLIFGISSVLGLRQWPESDGTPLFLLLNKYCDLFTLVEQGMCSNALWNHAKQKRLCNFWTDSNITFCKRPCVFLALESMRSIRFEHIVHNCNNFDYRKKSLRHRKLGAHVTIVELGWW